MNPLALASADLVYARGVTCKCGAGIARPRHPRHGESYWGCSRILTGHAEDTDDHDEWQAFPEDTYEKMENDRAVAAAFYG